MKTKTHLSDLDLEVLNPIETKKVIGGNWYDYHDIEPVIIDWGGGGSSGGGDWWGTGPYYPDNGGGDYGGGGYGNDGPGQTVHLPHNVTMDVQAPGMGACVSYAMAFASSYLGHNVTGTAMAMHNASVLGVNVGITTITGLTVGQAQSAIQSYFNTNSLSNMGQVENALNQNHTVIAGEVGHEVNIIGYDNNTSTFDVWDPNLGYTTISYGTIDLSMGTYEITGVKP